MKKRLISLIVVVALCFAVLPVTALAAPAASVTVGGVELSETGYYPVTAGAPNEQQEAAPSTGGYVYFDASAGELTLHDAVLTGTAAVDHAAAIYAEGDLSVVLEGANTATGGVTNDNVSYGIMVEGNLTFSGTGSLTARGQGFDEEITNASSGGILISSSDDVTLEVLSGTVTAIGGFATANSSIGIAAIATNNASILVQGGQLIAKGDPSPNGESQGIMYTTSSALLEISGGDVSVSGSTYGINFTGTMTSTLRMVSGSLDAKSTGYTGGTTLGDAGIYFAGLTNKLELLGGIVNAEHSDSAGMLAGGIATLYGLTVVSEDGNSGVLVTDGITDLSGTPDITGNLLVIENGEGTVYGDVVLDDDITLPEGGKLTIPDDTSLTISEGVTVKGDVQVDEGGDLIINGTLEGNITGDGTVTYGVTGVELNKTQLTLTVGDKEELTATVSPANATNKDVTWTSSAPGVATVENGTVTAVSAGTAEITATAGGKTATCTVTVKAPATSSDTEKAYYISIADTAHGTVTVDPTRAKAGETVTITAKPDSGYEVASITVTDTRGNQISVSGNRFTMPNSIVTVTVVFREASPFSDVDSDDWFFQEVLYVYQNGLMDGVGGGKFAPNSTVTRAMVWTVLARMEGVDTDGGDTWYSKARTWAMEEGVSDGTNPTSPVTREQLATMLYRYAGSPAVSGELSGYSDIQSVSDWAENAMTWATQVGLVNGSNGKLNPQDGATRAQLAAMLMRFVELDG